MVIATTILAMLGVFVGSIIGAFGAFFLKQGSNKLDLSVFSFLNKRIIVGVTLYGCSLIIALFCFRFADLSLLYPIGSTTYIWVILLSRYKLDEEINTSKVLGIIFIIIGVLIIGFTTKV